MNIAVIFAGGTGTRMASNGVPKQFLNVYNKPVLIYTLEVFEECSSIDAIVLVSVKTHIDYATHLAGQYGISKLKRIVPGGETGQESIYAGLKAAEELAIEGDAIEDCVTLIHDGVRPLINSATLKENIASVRQHGSAITCAPVVETIVTVGEGQKVNMIADRDVARLARAPQSFYLKDILELHDRAKKDGLSNVVDSCTLMYHYGRQPYCVDGPLNNIKITMPQDFFMLKALLDLQQAAEAFEYPEN